MRKRIKDKILKSINKNPRKFDRRITGRGPNDIIELECGHHIKIFDKKLLNKTEIFCSECVIKFLSTQNKEINNLFEKPLLSKLYNFNKNNFKK